MKKHLTARIYVEATATFFKDFEAIYTPSGDIRRGFFA